MIVNGSCFRFLKKLSDLTLSDVDRRTSKERITSLSFHPDVNTMLIATGSEAGVLGKEMLSVFDPLFVLVFSL